jgi:hypothetical protein
MEPFRPKLKIGTYVRTYLISAISGDKIGVFVKNQCYELLLVNNANFFTTFSAKIFLRTQNQSKKCHFRHFLGQKKFNRNIGPRTKRTRDGNGRRRRSRRS